MRRPWFVFVTLVVLPIAANDTLATLGAGGLIPLKTSTIVLESEDLEVSVHQITVRYVFRNVSDRDIDATVAFPLPELDGGLVENEPINLPSSEPVNFVDFHVAVNGKTVPAQIEARAFKDEREITTELRLLRLPVSPLDSRIPAMFRKFPTDMRARLQKSGWMQGCERGDLECWPYWQLRVQYHWIQRFPARSTIEVEHTYRPVVGGSFIVEADDGESSVKPNCGGADVLAAIRKAKKIHPAASGSDTVLLERRIQYILTTANNWSGPIRNFRFVVLADSPDDIVVTCMPGISRTGPTRYELARSNFHPDRELDVLILQAAAK